MKPGVEPGVKNHGFTWRHADIVTKRAKRRPEEEHCQKAKGK